MKNLSYCFLIFIALSKQAIAQGSVIDIVIGKSYQLPSEKLGDKVAIQISTPNGYEEEEKSYPVLYILDGQWFFSHGISIRSDYTERNGPMVTPEFIVVGIVTDNDKRWEWAMENTTGFLNFLEKDLFPFVDTNYRTSEERLLFGWETTGGFVIKALGQRPQLFSAYLAASPAPLYGKYFQNLEHEHLEFDRFLESDLDLDKFLFIGEGESDYPVQYGTVALITSLTKKAPGKLHWQHTIMKGVSHQMSAYHTLQQGLHSYYNYYHFLTFNSKAEFVQLGGLEYVEAFYEKRSDIFEIKDDSNDKHATRRDLTFLAISQVDYEWFDFLLTTFAKDSLIEKSFPPHLNDYAQFYLRHSHPEKALEIISYVIKKYPDNAQGFNSLGDVYVVQRKMKEAKKYYEMAVEIGNKNDDWRIAEYKNDLLKITTKEK